VIHTLPGNRLENLAEALALLLAVPVSNPLAPDVIMVQHQGMQHWLSMQLAQHRDRHIAMNLQFPLPVRHMWTLIRQILGERDTPQHTGFEREVLAWRLFDLLADAAVVDDPAFVEPTRYWQQQSARQQAVRRFQLAEELADLYEQYQMYRPDWIEAWDRGMPETRDPADPEGLHWQGRLWGLLVAAQAQHPVALLRKAMDRLGETHAALPQRLFIVGINTLAPLWLDFLKALSDRQGIDIFVLYLNPTDEYWEDATSERQAARQRAQWLATHEDDADFIADTGNPLVTGLGQQGQQFVRLLSRIADLETACFESPDTDTLLAQLQRDMLRFHDGRTAPTAVVDDSITVTSAHSALREVQGLHDWLLHRFNDDPTLTPKDVVVLCPNVEQYAPFVEAVFAGRFDALADTVPPLPCSIADRNPGNADPTIAAFLELLALPDARFQVTQVLSWLQVPALQLRFGITADDLERIRQWLDAASVHWGLDATHKQQWVPGSSAQFSWQQGLERLLLGFAWGDSEAIVGDRLLLPQVEGAEALLLGRLIAFVQALEDLLSGLRVERNLPDWQSFLDVQLCSALLGGEDGRDSAREDLATVIRTLGENAALAGFSGTVPLTVVRHVLEQALAAPAHTGRQFLAGQITVCSMVPMRAIPFRVVALLGLNDGDFPRQRPPLGFDRIAHDEARAGDRSRRGDDRYLFLEALLSARDALYLSYQGRDVRTNGEKQPSIVLAELLAYLEASSGWRLAEHRVELPLQPFSAANFRGERPAFDTQWLRLLRPLPAAQRVITLPLPDDMPQALSVAQLVRALEHPARYFAQQRLRLYLNKDEEAGLEDAEPFTANLLDRYRIQQQILDALFTGNQAALEHTLQRAQLSGELPDHPLMADVLQDWQVQASGFVEHVAAIAPERDVQAFSLTLNGLTLSGEALVAQGNTLLHYRLASVKAKDRLSLWLYHLLANTQADYASRGIYRGKHGAVTEIALAPIEAGAARAQLDTWLALWRNSLCTPLPLCAQLALDSSKANLTSADLEQRMTALWEGARNPWRIDPDPYLTWFWPEAPAADGLFDDLQLYYQPLIDALGTQGSGEVASDD